jgi:hypothetical protein
MNTPLIFELLCTEEESDVDCGISSISSQPRGTLKENSFSGFM